MKIVDIRELAVPLQGQIANAVVNFAEHDVTLLALITDVVRQGRPVVGLAFNSIGRFAQSGILRHRMLPRLHQAAAESLLDDSGRRWDPARVLACVMRNEKPGGHGDRSGAAAAIELAVWDLNAKLADEPAHATIAQAAGRAVAHWPVDVYAAGGYYYAEGSGHSLGDEMRRYRDMGYQAFKMKIGGASLSQDIARIEEALAVAGHGSRLAVDANGRFDLATATDYARAIAPYGLRWFEEVGDPLDYSLNRAIVDMAPCPVATGENLFSAQDLNNLVQFGGMRPGSDIFQMDPGLSYGLGEYLKMIETLEQRGFSRRQCYPHGGHLINLHIVTGLGLGGCESYPGVFQPFGGYSPGCRVEGSTVQASDAPGFGLEEKPELLPFIQQLTS
jgi:L-alanine-DL-glutamate epimerase-like enolase superfamily enzyme